MGERNTSEGEIFLDMFVPDGILKDAEEKQLENPGAWAFGCALLADVEEDSKRYFYAVGFLALIQAKRPGWIDQMVEGVEQVLSYYESSYGLPLKVTAAKIAEGIKVGFLDEYESEKHLAPADNERREAQTRIYNHFIKLSGEVGNTQ